MLPQHFSRVNDMQEAEIWLALQGGLPWWTWQAEEPTEELDQELLTGSRPRNHSSTSARTPGDRQEVRKGMSRGGGGHLGCCAQIDRWIDSCVYIVLYRVYAPFHLEVLSVLLVFRVTPLYELSALKMASRLLHPQSHHRQKQRWRTDTNNKLTTAHVYLVLLFFKTIRLSHFSQLIL